MQIEMSALSELNEFLNISEAHSKQDEFTILCLYFRALTSLESSVHNLKTVEHRRQPTLHVDSFSHRKNPLHIVSTPEGFK